MLPTRLILSRALQSTSTSTSDRSIESVSVRESVRVLMLDDGEAPKAPSWRVCREVRTLANLDELKAHKKCVVKGVDVSDSFVRVRLGRPSERTVSLCIGVKDTSRRERARQRDMTRDTLISVIEVCLSFRDRRHAKGIRSTLVPALCLKMVANVTSVWDRSVILRNINQGLTILRTPANFNTSSFRHSAVRKAMEAGGTEV